MPVAMDENVKKILLDVVVSGTLEEVQDTFYEYKFEQDESYFDYELLKAALRRRQKDIILFLLDIGCRVKNPSKCDFEETPLHLVLLLTCGNFKTTNSDLTLGDLRKIMVHLLEKGASIYDKNSNGDTPLYAAFKACGPFHNTLMIAFNILQYNFKQENVDDVLHFHIACAIYHKWVVERFPKCGFDLSKPMCLNSEQFNLIGFSPIEYAIIFNNFHFFVSFMKHSDFSVKKSDGSTYLHAIYQQLCLYGPLTLYPHGKSWIKQALRSVKNKTFVNSEDKNGVSHFHVCCFSDELEFIQAFIDNGVNVNKSISMESTYSAGYTALHIAVEGENERVIDLLLKNGADPNKACKSGETPLHLACKKSKIFKIRKLLLDYKASPIIANSKGLTPLHIFVYNIKMDGILIFDTEMSKALWGSMNYEDKEGLSLFHIACMTNDVNRVEEFLDSGTNIDSQVHSGVYKGFTALHFAVIYKQKEIVEFLLKRNAKVNVELDATKLTPLHLACEYLHYMNFDEEKFMHECRSNQLDIIKLLLLYGAHVDAKDSSEMTPLLHTCMVIKNARRLIYSSKEEKDKIKEARDKLREEIGIRLLETIKILICNKANINARTSSGLSILHIISQCKNLKMSKKLMKILISGVDVNAVNDAGLTPLHVAAQSVNKNMVTVLLKHDANPNIQCKKSKTPLHVVAKKHACYAYKPDYDLLLFKCQFIIKKLLEHGADVNVNSSYTAFLFEFEESKRLHKCYGKLVHMIYTHVQKLLALELPVCHILELACIDFHELYKVEEPDCIYVKELESGFKNSCLDELDKMKKTKLDNYTSVYDILLKDPHELTNHVKNRSLIKILEDDKDFPLYSYLLRLQFKRGLLRRQIMQSAEAALRKVPNINLPGACYNLIFKYLNNKDIANLKKATHVKCNLKRKLGDNYSNYIEFASKLKKIR